MTDLHDIELAFAADKNWRWFPGMDCVREDGCSFRLTADWMAERDDIAPNLEDAGTLGCIEHGLLPAVWASVGDGRRVEIEFIATHAQDRERDCLVPAYICSVRVWCDVWRTHWSSPSCPSKADAMLCRTGGRTMTGPHEVTSRLAAKSALGHGLTEDEQVELSAARAEIMADPTVAMAEAEGWRLFREQAIEDSRRAQAKIERTMERLRERIRELGGDP